MQVTKEWMQRWFRTFNHDYFDGRLPEPGLKTGKSRTRLGTMSCKRATRLGRTHAYGFTITLSNYYDQPERGFQNVLLHEMIHYAIAYTGLKDTSTHGVVFRGMMDALNRRYGWNIAVRTSVSGLRSNFPSTPKTFLVLAIVLRDGRHMLSVVNPHFAGRLELQLRKVDEVAAHQWVTSGDDRFRDFPQVRSLRGRIVSKEEWERVTERKA